MTRQHSWQDWPTPSGWPGDVTGRPAPPAPPGPQAQPGPRAPSPTSPPLVPGSPCPQPARWPPPSGWRWRRWTAPRPHGCPCPGRRPCGRGHRPGPGDPPAGHPRARHLGGWAPARPDAAHTGRHHPEHHPAPVPGPQQVAAAVVGQVREVGDLSLLTWSDDAHEPSCPPRPPARPPGRTLAGRGRSHPGRAGGCLVGTCRGSAGPEAVGPRVRPGPPGRGDGTARAAAVAGGGAVRRASSRNGSGCPPAPTCAWPMPVRAALLWSGRCWRCGCRSALGGRRRRVWRTGGGAAAPAVPGAAAAAVTDDLAFWAHGYAQVRSEPAWPLPPGTLAGGPVGNAPAVRGHGQAPSGGPRRRRARRHGMAVPVTANVRPRSLRHVARRGLTPMSHPRGRTAR